jgi:hypothetical protein
MYSGMNYLLSPGDWNTGMFCATGTQSQSNCAPRVMIPANQWIHLVQTYDGRAVRGYLNGELVSSRDISTNPSQPNNAILLMRRFDSDSMYRGNLAVVRIYNQSLSDAEVARNYNSERRRFGLDAQPKPVPTCMCAM